MPSYNTNNAGSRYIHGVFVRPTNRGDQQTIQRIIYPPTPMIPTIPLPIEDEYSSRTTTSATRNSGRQPLIARPAREQPWSVNVNAVLAYQRSLRPVVEPIVSDMPAYPGHMWGARDPYVDDRTTRGQTVHFASSSAPATNPPLVQLRLATPHNRRLVVHSTVGNSFVSVSDVQRTVIAWMRRVEEMTYGQEGPGLTRKKRVRARDGTTMEVNVWVWSGLVKMEGGIDLWAIVL